ncbi:uncharacterized protein HMPREF1541_03751 [Cyphellophora europaea CBS 101466]|uniref:3-oxoacyl-[acyl-carrier protein] reductase n=1 Tax=Cyphellophora europaea (strain CBS 101466) TaxID=1220924 RepID=W2S1H2_CYPE1|nr:uncharacterized protein HMPREF1541_03751 [Cyphellophora europaea CBS 101466]ETN41814.1 hypothetical protein HMPREF1541_03751 [Cyphellophora europaea CBS 101466]
MAAILTQPGANLPPIRTYPDKFAGQVVLITGAAQGIGEATAELFAAQGASLALIDKNDHLLNTTHQVTSAVAAVLAAHSQIDISVHLAGAYPLIPLLSATLTDFHTQMNTNMLSAFLLTRAVLPGMQQRGYGRIINTASEAATRPEVGLAIYGAAKGAVAAFTRATALEAGPGVTANYVSPSLIATKQTLEDPDPARKKIFDMCVGRQCVKRWGLAGDVARTVCWIAGPETEFVTGQGFDVGGGTLFT